METAGIRKAESLDEARPATPLPLNLSAPQLFVVFALELLAINLARLPYDLYFDRFAFFDNGANLTLQYLISIGYRPAIDFGYHYGLLAALIGRVWFGGLGATPHAYQWAMVTGAVLFAWALARIFARLKIGAAGLTLLILSLGLAFQSTYPNLAQCIEAVILAHALAEQVRGSYRNALALATIAVFVKPSMGYVFGFLLLLLIVRDLRRDGGTVRDFIATVTPAAIVFAILSVLLIGVYGERSFFLTIVTDRRLDQLSGVELRPHSRLRTPSLETGRAAASFLFHRYSRLLDREHSLFGHRRHRTSPDLFPGKDSVARR